MSNLACRVAALILVCCTHNIAAAVEPAGSAPTIAGGWGFDFNGADFANNPGDDFFRYGNGAWLDRAVIPPDRSSIGVDTVLSIAAEARIREILERGENGIGPSLRADAVKIRAFYAACMDEARAEALDVQPIAPLLQMIRAAATREEVAGLMCTGRRALLSSVFGLRISPDLKAPDTYPVP